MSAGDEQTSSKLKNVGTDLSISDDSITGRADLQNALLNELVEERTKELLQKLEEKDLLIKENHHRTKNNLQTLLSLIRLQDNQNVTEQESMILRECQNRIRAMALIHEEMYLSEDLKTIELLRYSGSLADKLFNIYGRQDKKIDITVTGDRIHLRPDEAIPCGLIMNEAITNSFEHAFPDNNKGKILVDISNNEDKIRVRVRDTGIGLPAEAVSETDTLGIKLITLLSKQLGGDAILENSNGASWTITFPRSK